MDKGVKRTEFRAQASSPDSIPRVTHPEPVLQSPPPDSHPQYRGRLIVELWAVSRGDGLAYAVVGNFPSEAKSTEFVREATQRLSEAVSDRSSG